MTQELVKTGIKEILKKGAKYGLATYAGYEINDIVSSQIEAKPEIIIEKHFIDTADVGNGHQIQYTITFLIILILLVLLIIFISIILYRISNSKKPSRPVEQIESQI